MDTAANDTPVETTPTPAVMEAPQPPDCRLCTNERCRKGPDGTRGVLKSPRAKYCSNYCRVDVCRRKRKLRPEQMGQPKRKRRSDAKWESPVERKREYERKRRESRYFFRTYWIPSRDKIPR